MKKWPANIMTAGNLFCGFFSVLSAFDGHPLIAAWLIMFAMLLDAFDGKAARFFGGGSRFGLQFDSMADMVSFGVAPAALIYSTAFVGLGLPGLLVTFAPVLGTAVRLARFNLTADGGHHDFVGLSSPLHASLLSSFVIMSYSRWGEVLDANVLAALALISSVLMVSKLPLPGLPRFTLREPGYNMLKSVVLLAALALMILHPARNTFPVLSVLIVCAFIVGGIRSLVQRSRLHELGEDGHEMESAPVPVFRNGRR